MAHGKLQDGRSVVNWVKGDPEGDRKYLFQAYTDFINEVHQAALTVNDKHVLSVFDKWQVSTQNQVDDFPRIWIKRPE